jgi:hypothetical protein
MKNSIVFISLIGLLMAGCGGRGPQEQHSSASEDELAPPKIVVSIPTIVLNKVIADSDLFKQTPYENLKELWNYDNTFSEVLAKNRTIGPRVLTRKVNPCCPCMGSGEKCCDCARSLYFGSPASMNTTLTFDGDMLKADSSENVNLYQIPLTKPDGTYTLSIEGSNIAPPVELQVEIRNGKIDF